MTEPVPLGDVLAGLFDTWPPPGTLTDPDDPYYDGRYAP